jgi:hypothetical protein
MPIPSYNGDPPQPFPWLTWNNRPFANHFELMLVPASSPARLPFEFSQRWSPQGHQYRRDLSQRQLMQDFRSRYAHLMNFFYSSAEPDTAPHYFRIFDFLEVPSRFVGTEKWYDLAVYGDAGGTSFRRAPHRVSRFRDPGRINLNTVYDERVWRALMGGRVADGRNADWSSLEVTRQGFQGNVMSSIYPTRFTNPFRSAGSADLMPFVAGLRRVVTVDGTFLRQSPNPFIGFSSSVPYQGTGRKPYFNYQGYQRVANLVTTHSNVFAVWITVGFFEVDADVGRLGQELDLDTGKARRHRAFYIIDRSVPVAFEPGKNHNVDCAIVLRRFIE